MMCTKHMCELIAYCEYPERRGEMRGKGGDKRAVVTCQGELRDQTTSACDGQYVEGAPVHGMACTKADATGIHTGSTRGFALGHGLEQRLLLWRVPAAARWSVTWASPGVIRAATVATSFLHQELRLLALGPPAHTRVVALAEGRTLALQH